VKILDPVAPAPVNATTVADRIPTLAGITVAVLTNRWKSMDLIAQRLAEKLTASHGAKDVRIETVPLNGGAKPEVLEKVGAYAGLAVVGLAN
jgi:hypothetical protein